MFGKMTDFRVNGALFNADITVLGVGKKPHSGVSARDAGSSGRGAVGGGAGGIILARRRGLRLK